MLPEVSVTSTASMLFSRMVWESLPVRSSLPEITRFSMGILSFLLESEPKDGISISWK